MKKPTKASYRNRKRAATEDLTPRQLVSGKSAHPGGANFVMGDGSVRMGDGSVRLLKTAVSN